jgi:hypothetical protein
MPIERGGYGYGLYSDSDYGTEGVIHTGSAATSVSSSATASGYTTTLSGAISGSASSSSTASCNATFASGAVVSSTASTASVAEQFVLKESDKFSYGSGAYGYNVYDSADLQTIVSATSVASTASGERVQSASATASVSASTSGACERVREQSSEVSASATGTAVGVYTIVASATVNVSSPTNVTYIRKRNASSAKSVTSVVSAIGREKWEPIAYTSITWSDIAA